MTDAAEEEIKTNYITPLYAIFKDATNPADVRVGAYHKVREIVALIDALKKTPDRYSVVRASAIFNTQI